MVAGEGGVEGRSWLVVVGWGWGRRRWCEIVAAREEWIMRLCRGLWPVPRGWLEREGKLGFPSGWRIFCFGDLCKDVGQEVMLGHVQEIAKVGQ